jgi:hypothetical protein
VQRAQRYPAVEQITVTRVTFDGSKHS